MISRFRFNISCYESFKNLFKLFVSKKNENFEKKLKLEISKIYPDSNLFFFDHGRTAFYEILSQIKQKTNKRKILVNSFTLFEIINVIIYCGFTPVFIDTKKNSFETEIDLAKFNNDLSGIAGILITHLNGANLNIINLKKQIDEHNQSNEKIYLIEDCAVALGAKINEKDVGTFGDYSFLSFNIMKNLTSYTGGALIDCKQEIESLSKQHYKILNKLDILKKILFIFTIQLLNTRILFPLFFIIIKYAHKYSVNFFLKKYRTDFVVTKEIKFPDKFSYFMHPFQKKLLLPQFIDFKKKQLYRISKSEYYFTNLKKIKSFYFPQSEFNEKNIFLDFPIICDSFPMKEKLFNYLIKKKVDIKSYYYKNCAEESIYIPNNNLCLNSSEIAKNILMLPVHEGINQIHQNKIINEVENFFKDFY